MKYFAHFFNIQRNTIYSAYQRRKSISLYFTQWPLQSSDPNEFMCDSFEHKTF